MTFLKHQVLHWLVARAAPFCRPFRKKGGPVAAPACIRAGAAAGGFVHPHSGRTGEGKRAGLRMAREVTFSDTSKFIDRQSMPALL
jgi:hypothetical protein